MTTIWWISTLNTPWPFLGLWVPAVTFLLAMAALLLGMIFGFRDFVKVNRLSSQLSRLIGELKSAQKPVNQEVMHKIKKGFYAEGICNELQECWEEFYETLLSEKYDNGDVIYTNTLQAEQFFTASFIFRGLPTITNALPSIATGIGLLGTFTALLCGLAELHVGEAGAVDGIGPFINALSGKFFSSIAGLGTALVLTIYLNTYRRKKLDKELHAFQHQLNVLFPRRSSESILLDLKKELVRIDKAVGHLATDMADKLPEVIQNTLGGDMQSLLHSINNLGQATEALKEVNSTQLNETLLSVQAIRDGVDKLHAQNNDAITESIRGMMDDFRKNFSQSASSEMNQLTQNLGQAAQFLEGMQIRSEQEAQRQKVADARLNQLIEAMEQANQKQQEQVTTNTAEMNSLLQQVVEQASQLSQSGKQNIQEQMKQLLEQSEQQGQEWRKQMEELVGQTLGQFQNGSQQQIEQVAKQSEDMAGRLNELLSRLDASGQQQQAQTQEALAAMRGQLENSAQAYSTQIQAKQSEFNDAIEGALTRLATFMESRESGLQHAYVRLESTQKALADTLSTGSHELGDAVSGLKEMLSLSRTSMEQLNAGQNQLSQLVSSLQESQSNVLIGLKDANSTSMNYQQAIGAMQALHKEQSRVYGELESALTNVLEQISTNLDRYTTRTNQGLSENLKSWDNELSTAVSTFANFVVDVKSSADDLTDALSDLATRMPRTLKLNEKELTNV